MEDKGHEDFEVNPNWSNMDMLLRAIDVTAQNCEKEKEALRSSEDLKISLDVSSPEHEILMKERALKKPTTEPVAIPKKHRSVIQAHRDTGGRNGLKRSYAMSGFQGDIGFKNQKNEENLSMRSKRRQRLDILPPDLPEDLKELIQVMRGTKVVKVIEKALYEADVNKNSSRLSMPFSQTNREFLNKAETEHLEQQNPITVEIFIEPSHKISRMILRQWDKRQEYGKTYSSYVLTKNWNEVSKANGLRQKDVIQVWSFRVGTKEQLCLALVIKCGENAKKRQFWQWGRNKQRRKRRKRGVWRCCEVY